MADPGAQTMFPVKKPVGGNILMHAVHTTVELKIKRRGEKYGAKVIDSSELAVEDCEFGLSATGVVDAE